jgi:hypothetical protein
MCKVASRSSLLDAHRFKIDAVLVKYPDLSAVRICEEIAGGLEGYTGSACTIRRYLRKVRPTPGRVYQEVQYEPGQAMQVDWGSCGCVQVGTTTRKVSVFVAVLCYSRLMFIEFTLSQRKAEFYRGIVNALNFFDGRPRAIIFDNLKAGVINGSGRTACFRCERRDPESKGIVEGSVRYIKGNALAGRADELISFENYLAFAPKWRDQVANVRIHETTRQRPVDRFQQERSLLHALPVIPYETDEIVPAVVTPHVRIEFNGNRYSVPPTLARQPVSIRADRDEVRILHEGHLIAQHIHCYQRGQLIVLSDHRLAAIALSRRSRSSALEHAFDALGPEARQFHLHLRKCPASPENGMSRRLGYNQPYRR